MEDDYRKWCDAPGIAKGEEQGKGKLAKPSPGGFRKRGGSEYKQETGMVMYAGSVTVRPPTTLAQFPTLCIPHSNPRMEAHFCIDSPPNVYVTFFTFDLLQKNMLTK